MVSNQLPASQKSRPSLPYSVSFFAYLCLHNTALRLVSQAEVLTAVNPLRLLPFPILAAYAFIRQWTLRRPSANRSVRILRLGQMPREVAAKCAFAVVFATERTLWQCNVTRLWRFKSVLPHKSSRKSGRR